MATWRAETDCPDVICGQCGAVNGGSSDASDRLESMSEMLSISSDGGEEGFVSPDAFELGEHHSCEHGCPSYQRMNRITMKGCTKYTIQCCANR